MATKESIIRKRLILNQLLFPITGLQGMGGNSAAAAAANAAHLMQFNPLYVQMYQLQMAQAALGKKSCEYHITFFWFFSLAHKVSLSMSVVRDQ